MLDVPNNRKLLPPSPWTDERTEGLKSLWADGLSASYIAGELGGGLTRNGVIGKVHRLGLPVRMKARARTKARANSDRSATQRIAKKLRLRSESNGGAQIVECVVREPDPEIAEFNIAVPVGQRCTLVQLTDETCHFPIGEVGDPGFFFCGGKTNAGTPYCGYHGRVCYQPSIRPVLRPYYATGRSKPAVF